MKESRFQIGSGSDYDTQFFSAENTRFVGRLAIFEDDDDDDDDSD